MEGFKEHQLVCRACLRIVENKYQSFGFIEDANGNLKDMIMCCVPEMDIYVSSQPIMCFPCIQLLITVYNFKTRCLNTETIIRSYIQRNNLMDYNHVNLSCVVEELLRLNNFFHGKDSRKPADVEMPSLLVKSQPNAGENQCYGPLNERDMQTHPFNAMSEGFNVPRNVQGAANQVSQGVHLQVNPINAMGEGFNVPRNVQGAANQLSQGVHLQVTPINAMGESFNIPRNVQGAPNQLIQGVHNSEGLRNCREVPQNLDKQLELPPLQLIMQPVAAETSSAPNHADEEVGLVPKTQETVVPREAEQEIQGTATSESSDNCPVTNEGAQMEPLEKRIRLVIKIDKSKITIPFDKNEDSNEKENEEQDTYQDENTISRPPPGNGLQTYQLQDTGQELYQCDNCTFVTTHLAYHVAHKKICCNELEKNDKKCPHCPHVTNRTYALNKHINTMHTRSVWYSCDICPYRSTDSSCLRRHKRNVHPELGRTQLVCPLCSHPFATEYHFKKHMLKHDENTIMQCQFCSYSTKDRSNFRKHVFTHNPKAEQCEFCSYKCVSPYQMKLHLKKMHHGVGMEDIDCRTEVSISEVVDDISAAINASTGLVGHESK